MSLPDTHFPRGGQTRIHLRDLSQLLVVHPQLSGRLRYHELAMQAAALVSDGGRLLCSTNHRGFPRGELRLVLSSALGSSWRLENVAMPLDFTGEQYLQAVWATRTA